MSTPSNEHPWRNSRPPRPSLNGRDTKYVTDPGHLAVIDTDSVDSDCPPDAHYNAVARSGEYIKARRLG